MYWLPVVGLGYGRVPSGAASGILNAHFRPHPFSGRESGLSCGHLCSGQSALIWRVGVPSRQCMCALINSCGAVLMWEWVRPLSAWTLTLYHAPSIEGQWRTQVGTLSVCERLWRWTSTQEVGHWHRVPFGCISWRMGLLEDTVVGVFWPRPTSGTLSILNATPDMIEWEWFILFICAHLVSVAS